MTEPSRCGWRTYQGVAHPECGNTVKIIVRLLYRLKRSGIPVRLAAWHCGRAENFNPLDGAVTLTADAPQEQVNALPFVLASFGTSMSISGLKSEGKAVLTAVLAVACIVGLGVIAGFTFMDLRSAIYGPIEVAGGGQAGLVFLTALREKSGTESSARALDYVLALCRSFGFRTKNANYRCGYAEIGEGRS